MIRFQKYVFWSYLEERLALWRPPVDLGGQCDHGGGGGGRGLGVGGAAVAADATVHRRVLLQLLSPGDVEVPGKVAHVWVLLAEAGEDGALKKKSEHNYTR